MSKIIVNVLGEPGVGKTTVALVVAKHLASHGLAVEVEDDLASATQLYNGEEQRLEALRDKKTAVVVRTIGTRKT